MKVGILTATAAVCIIVSHCMFDEIRYRRMMGMVIPGNRLSVIALVLAVIGLWLAIWALNAQ